MKIKKLGKNTVFKNGTIYDPASGKKYGGDVLITNGKIAEIGKFSLPKDAKIIDCEGLIVTHGFCDIHVHFREPGREDKETLLTGSHAALAGGFTRVCVMPNTNPPLDDPESIRFIKEKAEETPVHIHPIGAISKGQGGSEITEMGAMKDEGAIAFSDDGIPVQNAYVMRLALEYAKMIDAPIINHAEDIPLRNEGVMNESEISTRLGLAGNPDTAEAVMVQRDLEIAKSVSSKLHVPHVSTQLAVEQIKQMKSKIKNVSAEVTPHHLYFNDTVLTSYNTNLKVAPPIRTEKDRKALIEALKSNIIDCIATDHAPHTIEEKEAPFELAPFGMIGLESCYGAVNKVLVKNNKFEVEEIIDLLTINPREIMGFNTSLFDKNNEAEISVIDPDEEWTFQRKDIQSRSVNSPFIGEELIGKVKFTIVKGILAEI